MTQYILILALALGLSSTASAQELRKPQLIKVNGKAISLNPSYTAPVLFDLDKDGIKDLIVGEFWGGLNFHKNTSTNENPVYQKATKVKADGRQMKVKNW